MSFTRNAWSAAVRALWLVLALAPPAAVASDDWKPPRRFLSRDLPEWLTLGTELRLRWEDRRGLRFDPENNDGYLVTRFRINLGGRAEPSFRGVRSSAGFAGAEA